MSEITIETHDGRFDAYLAKPQSGRGPAILVIQEILGVNKATLHSARTSSGASSRVYS